MNEAQLAHFHPDERPFVVRMADMLERVGDRHETRRTDFLDPRQLRILGMLVTKLPELQMMADGGSPAAERQRAVIAPEYATLLQEDCGLQLLAITPLAERADELEHGDYLGALLGLGIKRDKIGDIHVRPDGCHVVIAAEMRDYIDLQMRQVGRLHVTTELLPIERIVPVVPRMDQLSLTVSSMRLDGIVGDVWRLSRAKSLVPIKAGRCKVNWRVTEDPAYTLDEGDTVSLQGFGRFIVRAMEGETKKGKIRLTIAKYV